MNPEVNGPGGPLSDSGKPGMEPFSGSSPKLSRLIDSIRSLEQWYTADFERRMASLTELLKSQITEELRSQYSAELDSRVEQIREQYEERLYEQASQWQLQRGSFEKEIEELRQKVPNNDVLHEIATVEEAVNKLTNQSGPSPEWQIPDAASLSKVMQSKVEELETKAYLRGLKFQTR